MNPLNFTEANTSFGPPADLEESQCRRIPAFVGTSEGGSCDGLQIVVVSYELTEEELACLIATKRLFFTMVGGLAPHYPSLTFHDATHPA